jgi:hypothetical protein
VCGEYKHNNNSGKNRSSNSGIAIYKMPLIGNGSNLMGGLERVK